MLLYEVFNDISSFQAPMVVFIVSFEVPIFFPYVMFNPTFLMAFHVMFDRLCSSLQSTFHKFVDLSTILRTSFGGEWIY